MGIQGELAALDTLRQRIERETVAWGGTEEREFHAHLTIGRIKEGDVSGFHKLLDRMETLKSARFGAWKVSEICLMRSELAAGGARHTLLARSGLIPS